MTKAQDKDSSKELGGSCTPNLSRSTHGLQGLSNPEGLTCGELSNDHCDDH